jgi:large subunit ribosomal protein L25
MAKFEFELEVEPREMLGKGASRRLRLHEAKVPAIIYGGKEKPESVSLSHLHVMRALENEAVYSHILTLSHKGKKQKVVLKDMQRHPVKPRVLHMDFLRVDENKPLIMHVPVHFLGQDIAPGVVLEGGTVTHHMVELEVECLPRDLPEFIEIDLSKAPLDTVVHLSQINLPKNVTLVAMIHGPEDDLPVVSIHKPKRVEIEEEAPAETEASDAKAKDKSKEKPKEASANKNGKK